MSTAIKKIGTGLRKTPHDPRDLKLGAIYTLPKLETIPDEFDIGETIDYKDQGDSDFCPGCGVAAASEYQEGEPLSYEFQFMLTKLISGDPIEDWGGNIRDALKGAVKIGSLPFRLIPSDLHFDGSNRDFVANPANWPQYLKDLAYQWRKKSYFEVVGQYDLFDDIRATMWLSVQEKQPRAVVTGMLWRQEWTQPDGIVPKEYGDGEFGHCFIFKGVVKRNGELMLKAQLSNGKDQGDGGYYYFSRQIVNKEIPPYKAFVLRDIDPEVARVLVDNNLSIRWKFLAHAILFFKNLFNA